MSHASFTFGRFNPPTESGHGKLVSAVQAHAEEHGGQHYIFPSHTQDKKKNPLSHEDKVHAMKKMFKGANVVSHEGVHTAIDAMKHLEKKGHTHVTMVVGSDRVPQFHKLLNDYNGKEYNFKKINVVSAGHRDPDAEGAEGMSASKMRGLVKSGKRDEFISHYSDKKLGAHLHDKVKQAMSESVKAMFILGGPGSGKDYVINNILNRFDLVEVQLDQILVGSAKELIESQQNLLINAPADLSKIDLVKNTLGEDYDFSYTLVSVSNKVSRERNESRGKPMNESVRIRKWLDAEQATQKFEDVFVFNNSINLKEANEAELANFQQQIANYLGFLIDSGLTMEEVKEPTGGLRNACWKGYTAVGMKMKNGRKVPNCVPVKEENNSGDVKVGEVVGFRHHGLGDNIYGKVTSVEADHVKMKSGSKTYAVPHHMVIRGHNVPSYRYEEVQNEALGDVDIFTKPTLEGPTKVKYKKKLVPPNDMNSRIDGAGGYSLGGLTQTEETDMLKFKEFVNEATHQGREVPLNKPMKGDVKKSKVYVRDPKTGNIKKVNFGDKKLSIKSHIPERKKSYCARSGGQGNLTDKTKANYWSRRAWKC